MAVEDGAVLGYLLGKLNESEGDEAARRQKVPDLLELFQSLRKSRTGDKVRNAVEDQKFYHLHDGAEQRERDSLLRHCKETNWKEACKWIWADMQYEKGLLGFDVLQDAEVAFAEFSAQRKQRPSL